MQVKNSKDEREAAENERVAAAVAEADRKAAEAAQKKADMRRRMDLACDKVSFSCLHEVWSQGSTAFDPCLTVV